MVHFVAIEHSALRHFTCLGVALVPQKRVLDLFEILNVVVLLQHELPLVLIHFLEDLDFGVQMLSVGQISLEEVLEGRQGLAFELAGLLPRQVAEVTPRRERQVAHHLAMEVVFARS